MRQTVAGNPAGAGGLLAWYLRLALARCTSLPPDAFWTDPRADEDGVAFRAALVAAYYLARRGAPAAWTRLAKTGRTREPLLVAFLEPYLKV